MRHVNQPDPRGRGNRQRPLARGAAVGWRSVAFFVALLIGTSACGSEEVTAPGPTPTPEAQLTFLHPSSTAPPLLTTDTTVVATRGQDLEVRIFYAPAPGSGSTTGEEFLRLKIEEQSLLRYPDSHPKQGALFQQGDTVSIRIQVDPNEIIATLEPTGLRFNPNEPAKLKLRYVEADDDIDGDGDDDPELKAEIDMWRQEKLGDPWFRVGTVKNENLDEVEADLVGFSRYALAI
jgi:hypothetical protein